MTRNIESYIEGAEKVNQFFGEWPSFHDAEVVEMNFWRGRIYPGDWDDRNVFPVITVKILVLEATQAAQSGSGRDLHTLDPFGSHKNAGSQFRVHDRTSQRCSGESRFPP